MRDRVEDWLRSQWYSRRPPAYWLRPPAALFGAVAASRRQLYRRRFLQTQYLPVPVVIVGNITTGGSGKTPFVIWLCERLKMRGYRPGVVTRGYGGDTRQWPQPVFIDSDPVLLGDEAVLLARRCRCPVYVGPDRVAAARALLASAAVDLIVSDDGLQHYALGRDCEIIMLDGARGTGNGYLLPAGPLREPPGRLASAALTIAKQTWRQLPPHSRCGVLGMPLMLETAINLATGQARALTSFAPETVRAVAAIAHPDDFFAALGARGLTVLTHAYADHAKLNAADIHFGDQRAVLMTEKDAVKCARFASSLHWYVPVRAEFTPTDEETIMQTVLSRIDM